MAPSFFAALQQQGAEDHLNFHIGPSRKQSWGKSVGLKHWRTVGSFCSRILFKDPISHHFCSSFSCPLPYNFHHIKHLLHVLTLISLLPATVLPDQKCSYAFLTLWCSTTSCVNKISTMQMLTGFQVRIASKTSKRSCGFQAHIFCGSHSLLVRSSISLHQSNHFTFKSQPIIKKRSPIYSQWWCNGVFSGALLGKRPRAKGPFMQF